MWRDYLAGLTRSTSTKWRVLWRGWAEGRYGAATAKPKVIKNQLWLPVIDRFFALTNSGGLICDRNASYSAKNAASTSPGLRHLGSTRRGLSPNSQALARVYKTFACRTSSGTIAARGSSTRRFRAHSAVCLIKTSKSGKRKPSRPPTDAVDIGSPPFGNKAAPCAAARKYPSRRQESASPCANANIPSPRRRAKTR
jgi:hypothetical protein